jgi:hypothetical protein
MNISLDLECGQTEEACERHLCIAEQLKGQVKPFDDR